MVESQSLRDAQWAKLCENNFQERYSSKIATLSQEKTANVIHAHFSSNKLLVSFRHSVPDVF